MPGVPAIPAALFNLLADPEGFLKKTRLRCAGRGINGRTMAQITEDHGVLSVDATSDKANVPVWNFRMIPNNEGIYLPAVTHLHITSGQPQIAVTGQLTGCTVIATKPSADELRITHVQPGGCRDTGTAVETELETQGLLNNELAEAVIGPATTYDRAERQAANVIGIYKKGDGWQVWYQVYRQFDDKFPLRAGRAL